MSPRVSVCIPAYKAERHLPDTLAAVWAQTFADFEVIVVDDASPDGTMAALQAESDQRLRVFRNARNSGQSATQNEALRHARGEYVKLLDADDLLHPECLEKMVAALDANRGASFVFCRRDFVLEDPGADVSEWMAQHGELHRYFDRLAAVNDGNQLLNQWLESSLDDNWVSEPAGLMIRRRALEIAGGYSRKIKMVVDMEFCARLMTCGDVCFLDEQLYTYRLTPGGNTQTFLAHATHWMDGLWAAEALHEVTGGRGLPRLATRRKELARTDFRWAASELRSWPPRTRKMRDMLGYFVHRVARTLRIARPLAPRIDPVA